MIKHTNVIIAIKVSFLWRLSAGGGGIFNITHIIVSFVNEDRLFIAFLGGAGGALNGRKTTPRPRRFFPPEWDKKEVLFVPSKVHPLERQQGISFNHGIICTYVHQERNARHGTVRVEIW